MENSKNEKGKVEYDRKCVYIGRRLLSDGKVGHKFLLLPENEPMLFGGKIKNVWLGYIYKCSASSISTKPERTEDEPIENEDWHAEDAAVAASLKRTATERKLERTAPYAMNRAIEALRPLVKDRSFFECQTLVNMLIEKARKK